VRYVHSQATALCILCWWIGLDVSHDPMAITNLVLLLLKADDDTRLCYRGGTAYVCISLCAGFLVLVSVIKTYETSIPKQLLSHWCSDGLGWTSLMLPWMSWTWFSTVYIWLLHANKHALLYFVLFDTSVVPPVAVIRMYWIMIKSEATYSFLPMMQ